MSMSWLSWLSLVSLVVFEVLAFLEAVNSARRGNMRFSYVGMGVVAGAFIGGVFGFFVAWGMRI